MEGTFLGLAEALRLTLGSIGPLPAEEVELVECTGRVAASDLFALVNSPSIDASLKDGYAVSSRAIVHATAEKPVRLRLLGFVAAGSAKDIRIAPGTAVKVLTGARLPTGADAVVAAEHVRLEGGDVIIDIPLESGRNVLRRGTDVAPGTPVLRSGQTISPGLTGLLAAAGYNTVLVFRNPRVGILGTGDEIVKPGSPLGEGKLYASNMATLAGWCGRYGMKTPMAIVKDDHDAISRSLETLADETDAVITSGGAWTGDRDLVARVLEGLGWKKVFHRVRIGPGKAVGFGFLKGKPLFMLPGGPPSNLMGFLQLTLPGLLALSGYANLGLPRTNAVLASDIEGREPDWTDFFYGTLHPGDSLPTFHPLDYRSRLSSIAEATAIASIPEEQNLLPKGSVISVQSMQ